MSASAGAYRRCEETLPRHHQQLRGDLALRLVPPVPADESLVRRACPCAVFAECDIAPTMAPASVGSVGRRYGGRAGAGEHSSPIWNSSS